MEQKTTRKTGNEPVEGADPGGTSPTKPGKTPSDAEGGKTWTEHKIESGDRNTRPPSPE